MRAGSEWTAKSLQYKCDENATVVIVGCLTPSGILVSIGEIKWVNGEDFECKMNSKGIPVLSSLRKAKCKDDEGKERTQGYILVNDEVPNGQLNRFSTNVMKMLQSLLSGRPHIIWNVNGEDMECKKDSKGIPVLAALGKT
ncbi:hypothetical protein KIN20_029984 [Parelaphostrongylus tenuis]|uniref:Uncharacterized protein n=1 Tax=Parelaphostrongylus tenuis TaxID=148309 RepID=A0AAD5R360_PARTN|nr:hypothetical protein KIN20_029984 [Parelaphostrongylus tenuis]